MSARIASLILSAGRSQRMGPENKLLRDLKGKSVLEHTVSAIQAAPFSESLAVVGHQAAEIANVLSKLNLRFVLNENYLRGLHSSIRHGLQNLQRDCEFFAICLADQPLLTTQDYKKLILAAQKNPQAKLIYPSFEGKRGNPSLISFALKDEVLNRPDSDRGCFYLFEKYPNESIEVELSSRAALMDVDTPELFAEAEAFIN